MYIPADALFAIIAVVCAMPLLNWAADGIVKLVGFLWFD